MSFFSGQNWTTLLLVASTITGCNVLLDNEEKTLTQEPVDGLGGGAGSSGGSGQSGVAGVSGTSGQAGGAGAGPGGTAGASGEAACVPEDVSCTCGPLGAAIEWDGACYQTQTFARGQTTLRKTRIDEGRARVVLDGTLTITDQSYGYTRHELPPGFMPASTKPYVCEVQTHAVKGDASKVPNYGSKGVSVRVPDLGYTGAVLWFPEKGWAGEFTLRCTWETEEVNAPGQWSSCGHITCL